LFVKKCVPAIVHIWVDEKRERKTDSRSNKDRKKRLCGVGGRIREWVQSHVAHSIGVPAHVHWLMLCLEFWGLLGATRQFGAWNLLLDAPSSSADDCAYMTWNLKFIDVYMFDLMVSLMTNHSLTSLLATLVWNDLRCGTSAWHTWSCIFVRIAAALYQLWPLGLVRITHTKCYLTFTRVNLHSDLSMETL